MNFQNLLPISYISKGYHLAECLHVPLGQVALENFAAEADNIGNRKQVLKNSSEL